MSQSSQVRHQDRIPNSGFLLLPNRLEFQEVLLLEKIFFNRKIVWLCENACSEELDPLIFSHLSREGIHTHSFDQSDTDSIAQSQEKLSELVDSGNVLIYLTGKANTNEGSHFHLLGKTLDTLTGFQLPTIPLCVNVPKEITLPQDSESLHPALLAFGQLIDSETITTARWQEAIFNLNEEIFSSRKLLDISLPYALLLGLKKFGKRRALYDGSDDSKLTYDKLLAAAIAFSRVLIAETDKERVAIILPPGKAGMVANLAVLFAGKIPVNLNFTASTDAIKSAIQQADIDRFITGTAFMKKVSSFPWPHESQLIRLEQVLPELKKSIIRWAITSKLLPAPMLASLLGIEKEGGHEEAVLLFTSGSSGEPKGVSLTHRNIIANVCQFSGRVNLGSQATVLGCLPLFHSFGSTVTLWYPILEGINLVTFTSPLDTKRLAKLIHKHQVDLLLSTPTFLRGFMKRVEPEQLASVKMCITGAEKLPRSIAQAFKDKFGILPHEGYGLTEASPVTNVNMADNDLDQMGVNISANRFGSVGQFLQGLSLKITDVETDEPISIDKPGIVWLKGANIFEGYLNNPVKSKEVIIDGWFKTGDVGRVDSDGFLYIEGRISRFSKIAGEMVPHEGVEESITRALELTQEEERRFAIVGIPDKQKGESIAMLSTIHKEHLEQECISLRYTLMDAGVPALWCPKKIVYTDKIPVLASGKLDIKSCEDLIHA